MIISDKEFQAPLIKLYRSSILRLITNTQEKENSLSPEECNRLIGLASALSLSENSEDINLSYEITTRLLDNESNSTLNFSGAADLIFSRIGNFPGRELLRKRYTDNVTPSISLSLSLERIAREAENSVTDETLLTNFQYKLYSSLSTENSLSVSAPTSAGKSFILNMDLMRRLASNLEQCIIYIVPTRALRSEVTSRVRSTLRSQKIENVIVRSAPFPLGMV